MWYMKTANLEIIGNHGTHRAAARNAQNEKYQETFTRLCAQHYKLGHIPPAHLNHFLKEGILVNIARAQLQRETSLGIFWIVLCHCEAGNAANGVCGESTAFDCSGPLFVVREERKMLRGNSRKDANAKKANALTSARKAHSKGSWVMCMIC